MLSYSRERINSYPHSKAHVIHIYIRNFKKKKKKVKSDSSSLKPLSSAAFGHMIIEGIETVNVL